MLTSGGNIWLIFDEDNLVSNELGFFLPPPPKFQRIKKKNNSTAVFSYVQIAFFN